MRHIQSCRIVPGKANTRVLFAGIANYDREFAINCLINRLGSSNSWERAALNMELLNPYLEGANDETIVDVLTAARENSQVANSYDARPMLIPLLESHGHLLDKRDLHYLQRKFEIAVQ